MATKIEASAARRLRQMGGKLAGSAQDWIALLRYSAAGAHRGAGGPSRVLPFELRPPLQTHPHHAHLLGMLPPESARWITTAYGVNISAVNVDPATAFDPAHHPSRQVHVDYSPYFGPYSCPERSLFTRTEWTDDWPRLRSRDLLQRVDAALGAGSYLQIHLNELFLRGSASWRRAHLRHQTLVYGYDQATDSLLCAGYDQAGEYNSLRLPRRLLAPALLSRGGSERTPYFAPRYIAALKPEPPVVRPLPLAWLRQQLADFCSSHHSGHEQPDGIYGRTVLRYLQLYFRACAERNLPPDRKITRFLWEMARGMEARLRTMVREGFSLLEHEVETASALEKRTNRLRLKAHAMWIEAETKTVDWRFLGEYEDALAVQEQFYEELAGVFEVLG